MMLLKQWTNVFISSINQSLYSSDMTLQHRYNKQSSEQDKQGTKCTYSCTSNKIYISRVFASETFTMTEVRNFFSAISYLKQDKSN